MWLAWPRATRRKLRLGRVAGAERLSPALTDLRAGFPTCPIPPTKPPAEHQRHRKLSSSSMAPAQGIDYDAFRREADPANWPAPQPLSPLDRAEFLGGFHWFHQEEKRLDQTGQKRNHRVVVGGPGKAWSSAPLESLERAELVGDGLRTDQTAKGEEPGPLRTVIAPLRR